MLCESALEKLEMAGLLELPRTVNEQNIAPTANFKEDLISVVQTFQESDCCCYLYNGYCWVEDVNEIIDSFLIALHEVLFYTKDCTFNGYQNIINNYYYLPDYRIIAYGDAVDSDRYNDPPDVCYVQLGIIIPYVCNVELFPNDIMFGQVDGLMDGFISRQIRTKNRYYNRR